MFQSSTEAAVVKSDLTNSSVVSWLRYLAIFGQGQRWTYVAFKIHPNIRMKYCFVGGCMEDIIWEIYHYRVKKSILAAFH